MVRSSIQRLGRLKAARSRPSSPMCLCTTPWTSGWKKWCNHPVGVQHGGAARRVTGGVPSACRRTRNGLSGCDPKGWRNATSRWHRSRPICDGSAVFTLGRSGATPCWDSSAPGCQSGTACHASCDAPRARSSKPHANGSRNGSSNTGTCRGGHSSSVCMRDYGATTITMACEGTPARSTAFSIGRWTVRSNGSIGGEASSAVTLGSSVPESSTASR